MVMVQAQPCVWTSLPAHRPTHSGTLEMLDCSSYPRQKISREQQLKQLVALSEKRE